MAITQLFTRAQQGMEAPMVSVEVHISNGLPAFSIVGLPEAAVRESRDRVRSAIINSGFEFPARRITVNLAPADLPKEGGRYDLAIALGILACSQQINRNNLNHYEFYAELGLSGELRVVSGLVPALIQCRQQHKVILAHANQSEAGFIDHLQAYTADSLAQVCSFFNGGEALPAVEAKPPATVTDYAVDLAEVLGQPQAKRALEIAAAGAHHLLMMGPPGTGKSMLAQRLNTLLPEMSEPEALQTLSIQSISNHAAINLDNWKLRPFRSPHHTVSGIALVGGGSQPKPGEISLAHNGVLFLDELTEFDRKTLEVLREPLETGLIHISRAARQATFPAACDNLGGGIAFHADGTVLVGTGDNGNRLARDELLQQKICQQTGSKTVRARVSAARQRQIQRQGCLNAQMNNRQIEQICQLDQVSQQLLMRAIDKLKLSARSYHRLLKLARSIADLAAQERISADCVSEAISSRLAGSRENPGAKIAVRSPAPVQMALTRDPAELLCRLKGAKTSVNFYLDISSI